MSIRSHLAATAAACAIGVAAGLVLPHVYGAGVGLPSASAVTPGNHPTAQPTSEDGEPVLTAAQRQALADRHAALVAALPNYGKEAPKGCYEDMVCWIGSAHDGRDDDSIIADLPGDIAAAEKAYPDEGTGWDHVTHEFADALAEGLNPGDDTRDWESCWIRVADTTVVVCPDGTVVTS